MTEEKLVEIFGNEDISSMDWEGDNAFQGLQIIAKYIDPTKNDLICGANHDVIYSVSVSEIVEAGITEKDVIKLKNLNWCVSEDEEYLECFV
jgi:hypothetical protein